MAEGAYDLRALVLNFRGAEMTMQVVRDLLTDDGVRASVVVLDNGSGADEQRALEDAAGALEVGGHEVRVVLSDENLGFAAAMSRGRSFSVRNTASKPPPRTLSLRWPATRRSRTAAAASPHARRSTAATSCRPW